MNKLMTDEELREAFKALHKEYESRLDDKVVDDGKTAWVWFYDSLVKLTKSQKQAHADMVIGQDISHEDVAERMRNQEDKASVHDAVYAVNDRLKIQRKRNNQNAKP